MRPLLSNLSISELDSSSASINVVTLKAKYSPSPHDRGKVSPFSWRMLLKTFTALRLILERLEGKGWGNLQGGGFC